MLNIKITIEMIIKSVFAPETLNVIIPRLQKIETSIISLVSPDSRIYIMINSNTNEKYNAILSIII